MIYMVINMYTFLCTHMCIHPSYQMTTKISSAVDIRQFQTLSAEAGGSGGNAQPALSFNRDPGGRAIMA